MALIRKAKTANFPTPASRWPRAGSLARALPLLLLALALGACSATDAPEPPRAEPAVVDSAAAETTQTPPETPTSQAEVAQETAPPTGLDAPVPLDPKVREGRLSNGLRYFIRENQRPANRAELRLVVNAGSLQETEEQLGLAHFVEHMAFNGTENFAKQEIVDYLEGIGMRFGPDLNAYTSFDETVYMLQVPTDDQEIVATAFDILEEWAHRIAFEDEEIDKERGVVIEEWRLRQGAGSRILDKQLPVTYHQSRYAERLPIGEVEILRNAPYEQFRKFYRDWYRPDLMALVAVGDFDANQIEAVIKEHFGRIPAPAKEAPERVDAPIPDHEETLVSIVADPEATSTQVSVAWKRPPYPAVESVAALRRDLVDELYHSMMIGRLQELAQDADPPYQFAFAFDSSLGRTKSAYRLITNVRDGGAVRGLEAMLVEAKRVRDHGFTASELERSRRDLVRSIERAYEERDKQESRGLVSQYVSYFLEGDPAPGIEFLRDFYLEALPGITLDEVNQRADQWMTGGEGKSTEANRIILVSGPDTEAAELPEEDRLLAVFDEIDDVATTPWVDRTSDAPLVPSLPSAGTIISEQDIPHVDAVHWTLSNGVEVYLKPTDFKNDQIMMSATSPGGHSLVSDEDYFNAAQASAIVGQMGLGSFGPIELGKKLTGKVAGANAFIGELSEGLSGGASPKDLETLFQLVYLRFTAPRFDEDAFLSMKSRMAGFLENQKASPRYWYGKKQRELLFGDHPRRQGFEVEDLERIDPQEALRHYRDRFADASDFTFFFVGNFELEAMRPLVTRWLAGLPSIDREETWRDPNAYAAMDQRSFSVERGLEPKAQVEVRWYGDTEWSRRKAVLASAAGQALRIRLREVLREDLGGVYGVGVRANVGRIPRGRYNANITFSTDPERVEELLAATREAVTEFQSNGPPQEIVDKVKESWRRARETQLEQNGFWLQTLQSYVEDERPWEEFDQFEERMTWVTPEAISETMQLLFNEEGGVLEGRLVPQAAAPAGESAGSGN